MLALDYSKLGDATPTCLDLRQYWLHPTGNHAVPYSAITVSKTGHQVGVEQI